MSVAGEREILKRIGSWINHDYLESPWHNAWRGSLVVKTGAILSALPEPPAKVLDAGCGSGYLCSFLSRSGYSAAGFDVCQDALDLIRLRKDYSGWPLFEHDWEKPFPESPYQAIVFNDAFHHCMNKPVVLRNVYGALAEDGIAVFVEPGVGHGRSARSHALRFDVTETDTPPYQIVRIGRRVGFKAWRVFPHPETFSKSLYGPKGMLTHHPLVNTLCRFGGTLGILLIAAKWFHGMTVLSRSGRWPTHVNPIDKLHSAGSGTSSSRGPTVGARKSIRQEEAVSM